MAWYTAAIYGVSAVCIATAVVIGVLAWRYYRAQ